MNGILVARGARGTSVAVLTSGGVESAAMLMEARARVERVYPIYVAKGLKWEKSELAHLRSFLTLLRTSAEFRRQSEGLARLTVLSVPIRAVYGRHWSLHRFGTPGFTAPDAAVFLPGRNLLLLSLAGLFCSIRKIPCLWIGILKGNPFHDAKAGFVRQVETLLGESLGFPLRIAVPLHELTKPQVIRRWPRVPWERTFSCLRPVGSRHCGRCQKCAERKAGFRQAEVADPTRYAP